MRFRPQIPLKLAIVRHDLCWRNFGKNGQQQEERGAVGDVEVEAALTAPPLTAAELEAKKARRVARRIQKVAAEKQRSKAASSKAKGKDSSPWPMPLTKQEARDVPIKKGDMFHGKNDILSKQMAICEREQSRFVTTTSRPVRIIVKCPFADCGFVVDGAYRAKPGTIMTLIS